MSLDSIAPLYLFGYMLGGVIEHRRLERRQESLVMQNPWAGLTKPGGNEEAHEVLGEKRGNYEVAQAQSAEDDVRVYSGNRRFRPAVCAMADS
ncbi:MAG TPA: hypothetical protein VFQ43_02935, partial [Nitrososphaera sp.]|nr:hypothetical protein [Nitrososphaera sp.]